ncbi:ribosomal protein S18 acetylase RimI-like enzyme [Rhizobium sp. BK316]|uniref:GNAT family N-acetyltransferase n=1 Tax=Rhizobium sp. BK316 TaxID=2587053 RepID=UPI00161518CA|nr:GNAT family N-acetyltransferase [Rhizobium sp. BK316]MBB3409724.1 ribosomal protein S18 acetylase RimI-like enzyme [Rhizobium sp. BK316]
MSGYIRIEPMTEGHIEGFHRVLDSVARERTYLTLLEAPPIEDTRKFALSSIAGGNVHLVALDGGELVGWCDIRRHFFPSRAHCGALGMGLLPDYRGRGLGRRLIAAAIEAAREAGMIRIELGVHADNARAIRLYESVGFVREGVSRDAFCVDGHYTGVINMAMIFR